MKKLVWLFVSAPIAIFVLFFINDDKSLFHAIVKSLVTGTLFFYMINNLFRSGTKKIPVIMLTFSFFMSSVGDFFMSVGSEFFMLGLLVFLIDYSVFIATPLLFDLNKENKLKTGQILKIVFLSSCLIPIFIPIFESVLKLNNTIILIAISIYALSIMYLNIVAYLHLFKNGNVDIFLALMLFNFSDLLIAANVFMFENPMDSRMVILPTYYIGQYLLVNYINKKHLLI